MYIVDCAHLALMAKTASSITRPSSLIPPKATFDSPGSGLDTSSTNGHENNLQKQLLNDKWRLLFDKYDPEGFGEIPWDEFVSILDTPEFTAEVDSSKKNVFVVRAQEKKTPAITFQDFVNIVKIEHFSTAVNVSATVEFTTTILLSERKGRKKRKEIAY